MQNPEILTTFIRLGYILCKDFSTNPSTLDEYKLFASSIFQSKKQFINTYFEHNFFYDVIQKLRIIKKLFKKEVKMKKSIIINFVFLLAFISLLESCNKDNGLSNQEFRNNQSDRERLHIDKQEP